MAGGKETPRQKMIGMMYLVLTALLALNVSKSILDAFVAIEENIQISNENEYQRGFEKKSQLAETALDKSVPEAQKKAQYYLKIVEDIDKMTAERIKFIDDIKIEILTKCQEDVKSIGKETSIIFKPYSKADPLRPTRMHLEHVAGMDKYDEVMEIMIGEEIQNPKASGKGMALWKTYNDYRKELTEKIAGSWVPEKGKKAYFFKAPAINEFKNFEDLNAKIDKAIAASNVNQEDKEAIKKIYASLTKRERVDSKEIKNIHWIGKTFDHSPSVAAIASLSSMQKEILTARADAIALIRSRVGGGEYSFNKIMALAYGPEVANSGDELQVEVLMAAFDSDRQPEVTVNGAKVAETRDGKGIIKMKASGSSEMVLKGTVTIRNKFGIPKTENWEKKITIMKPQGTVALPEMRVLYRGYPNLIEAVASGYDQTVLQPTGVELKKQGDKWIATPTGAKTAKIVVLGKSTLTNKTVRLAEADFQVRAMPKAEIFWGQLTDGDKASATNRQASQLTAKYVDSPLTKASFTITQWAMSIPGAPKTITGTGSTLSAEALKYLKAAPAGSVVSFSCVYSGTGVKNKTATSGIKL
jgi:gliding motility-associated protein GldM